MLNLNNIMLYVYVDNMTKSKPREEKVNQTKNIDSERKQKVKKVVKLGVKIAWVAVDWLI